ncbi:hypothetical protein DSO57_1033970 [Entomophthora muscae]|uniref:Uncharacterized protein n=1 Tax=Entomophthora muscae TaxID=34485 RepID=A0ACC2S1V4_9FUNG|nr:hypothetical protein DSO57_1033970 [Entomophthora muscae]
MFFFTRKPNTYRTASQFNLPSYRASHSETPPPNSFDLSIPLGSVTKSDDELRINRTCTLQTFHPLNECSAYFEVTITELSPESNTLVGFSLKSRTSNSASLLSLSLVSFHIGQGRIYLRGKPSPLEILKPVVGDVIGFKIDVCPELKVTFSINGILGPPLSPRFDSCIWSIKQIYPTIHATEGTGLKYSHRKLAPSSNVPTYQSPPPYAP